MLIVYMILAFTILFLLRFCIERSWKKAVWAVLAFVVECFLSTVIGIIANSPRDAPLVVTSSQNVENGNLGIAGKKEDAWADTIDKYIFGDSDARKLATGELDTKTAKELRIARNEIFARNGREFEDAFLQEYFMSCSWYNPRIPPDQFDYDTMLSDIEKYNADFIRQYEIQHGYIDS